MAKRTKSQAAVKRRLALSMMRRNATNQSIKDYCVSSYGSGISSDDLAKLRKKLLSEQKHGKRQLSSGLVQHNRMTSALRELARAAKDAHYSTLTITIRDDGSATVEGERSSKFDVKLL